MSLYRLAWQNARSGLKNYISLILSLAFTIMIFFNFQNLFYSDLLEAVADRNQNFGSTMVQAVSIVVGFFMIFFIGYAVSVFLTRRKKEIGVYIFMGLSNEKIGRMYLFEMLIVGILTLAAGIGFGILTTHLFQMILAALSDLAVDIGFQFSWQPVLRTVLFYLAVYLVFILAGYISIVRSSILNLISAGKQNEYVRQNRLLLAAETVIGVCVLSAGFYAAIRESGMDMLNYAVLAVVLVIIGVYFLFGGLIPMLFQGLAGRKGFLYQKERSLWMNQMIFRMRKNYRTYAVVCILMLCSVTSLAASFALRSRYEAMMKLRDIYTFQLLSSRTDLEEPAAEVLRKTGGISYQAAMPILQLVQPADGGKEAGLQAEEQYLFAAYTQFLKLVQASGLSFDLKEPADGETIKIEHLYLMSFYTKRENVEMTAGGRTFLQTAVLSEPYLGCLQENAAFYLVNDQEYESMKILGQEMYLYNYKIKNESDYQASLKALDRFVSQNGKEYIGRIAAGGQDGGGDKEWIKMLYSLFVFVVMVFIMAGGSILFMKLYNDAFEERERYAILQKMGFSGRVLRRSVSKELFASYSLPFVVMAVSSYFSVHAMEKIMNEELTGIRFISLGIILAVFVCFYGLSVGIYLKNAGVRADGSNERDGRQEG